MSPNPSHRKKYFILAVSLLLVTLGCSVQTFSDLDRISCMLRGGRWDEGSIWEDEFCANPRVEFEYTYDAEEQTDLESAAEESDQESVSSAVTVQVSNCLASSESFSWDFIDTKTTKGTNNTRCVSNIRVLNTGNAPILIYAYLEKSAGTGGDTYSGFGPGGEILEPGQVFQESVNQISYSNGEITYRRYPRILVLNNVPECRVVNPEEFDEELIMETFLVLPDPCQDSE